MGRLVDKQMDSFDVSIREFKRFVDKKNVCF